MSLKCLQIYDALLSNVLWVHRDDREPLAFLNIFKQLI